MHPAPHLPLCSWFSQMASSHLLLSTTPGTTPCYARRALLVTGPLAHVFLFSNPQSSGTALWQDPEHLVTVVSSLSYLSASSAQELGPPLLLVTGTCCMLILCWGLFEAPGVQHKQTNKQKSGNKINPALMSLSVTQEVSSSLEKWDRYCGTAR